MTNNERDPLDSAHVMLVGPSEPTADAEMHDAATADAALLARIVVPVDTGVERRGATSRLRDAVAASARRGQPLVVIGTSGSTDYLHDQTGGQRFWPVVVSHEEPPDDGQRCDGLHDESAPVQYLCSRCFPDRGDLAEPQEDVSDEARRDDDQEME